MEPTDLLYCPKCNEPARKIVVILESEVNMTWNDEEHDYEISESYHDFNGIRQQLCANCLTELVEPPNDEQSL